VDSASAVLADARVARFLRRKAEEGEYERYRRRFDPDPWASVELFEDLNVFVFHTWGGDGTFSSWFGYDADGEVVCLVIDMFIELDVAEDLPRGSG
jgi:hypothetical protein